MRRSRGFSKFSVFLLLTSGAIVAGGVYGFTRVTKASPLSLSFYERNAPEITWETTPKGLGGDAVNGSLVVRDNGAGLDEVIVRLFQKETPIEIYRKSIGTQQTTELPIQFSIDAKALGLKEGSAKLSVSAFDRSLWSNSAEAEINLRVDFARPRVEVMTAQQNGSTGGCEFVFYRVVGREASESGVELDNKILRGFKAQGINKAFSQLDNLYFALFPIPIDFDDKKSHFRIVAKDDFGNVATSPFNYRIQKKKISEVEMPVEEAYLRNKVSELLPSLDRSLISSQPNGDLGHDFKLINEDLRAQNEATIREVLANSNPEKLWDGALIRPLAAAPKATFAEKRTYIFNKIPISKSSHMGIDLADVNMAPVHAAASGKILFADNLGIYGNAIIIDHGVGLSTLYGHLSSFEVKAGDSVMQGQEIAKTGATGLAGGDHLHFEVRVLGEPVSPFEWWDPHWIKDHIEDKISSVERSINGVPSEAE